MSNHGKSIIPVKVRWTKGGLHEKKVEVIYGNHPFDKRICDFSISITYAGMTIAIITPSVVDIKRPHLLKHRVHYLIQPEADSIEEHPDPLVASLRCVVWNLFPPFRALNRVA